ncbi:MAG: HEAT repeat domain-containing protein, partial [Candidatus Aenigmarchaeota archaeon]|nr:HEAT repeat domain-containing protein [Candidatus Aenigmarchaeota archaeon]
DADKFHKMRGLAAVLKKIKDEEKIHNLIDVFKDENFQRHLYTFDNEDILASYTSKEIIELLVKNSTNTKTDKLIREGCSGALSKSMEEIPLSIFETLLKDENPIIRRNAARGLQRFDISEIRELLFKYIHDEDARVQHEIIEILGGKGILLEILEENRFPDRIVTDTLFYQIRKYKLLEFLPVLESFEKNHPTNGRFVLNIAKTYVVLEEIEKAKSIIENILKLDSNRIDKFCFSDLAELAPKFENKYGIDLIKKILSSINKLSDEGGYLESNCVEALERMSSDDALEILKRMADNQAKLKKYCQIERILRAINSLASEKDEEWYIKFLEDNSWLKSSDLRRAIEGLGVVGSEKSMIIIKRIAKENKANERIIENCYYSINNIHQKLGLKREITEKELFEA